MFTVNAKSFSYTLTVEDYRYLVEDDDYLCHIKDDWDNTICTLIDKIDYVDDADHNGHFGPYVFFRMEITSNEFLILEKIQRLILNHVKKGEMVITCPDCGGLGIPTLSNETENLEYGQGDDAVTLSVMVPVNTCEHCDFQFTDWKAEDIRAAAIKEWVFTSEK